MYKHIEYSVFGALYVSVCVCGGGGGGGGGGGVRPGISMCGKLGVHILMDKAFLASVAKM